MTFIPETGATVFSIGIRFAPLIHASNTDYIDTEVIEGSQKAL